MSSSILRLSLGFACILQLLEVTPAQAARPIDRPSQVVATLRAWSKTPRVTPRVVIASQTSKTAIQVGARRGQLAQSKQLVFDGKRARIEITTSSDLLRPATSRATVAVPTGRLLGWLGRLQIKTHFPSLTSTQVTQKLAGGLR